MASEWEFLVTLNAHLRPLRDPVEIQETAVRLIGQHLGATRASYVQIEGDRFTVRRSYTTGVAPLTSGSVNVLGTPIVEAYRRGETVVVTDAVHDPRFADADQAWIRSTSSAAFIAVPLIKGGQWVGALSIGSA